MTQPTKRTADDGRRSPHPPFGDIVVSLSKTGDLLATLREGPAGKAELADELGVSKSTVYNWIVELEDLGICERTADGYAITRIGRAHLRLYHDFADLSRRVYRDNELLDELPSDCVPPTPVLMDMSASTTGQDPYALVEQFTDGTRDADRIRCLLPVASSPILSAFSARLDAGDVDLEIVVESSVREYIQRNHPEFCRTFAAAERATLVETPATVEVGLCLSEGPSLCVALATCNDHGYITGVLTANSTGTHDWASGLYERHRAEGEVVDLLGADS